MRDTGVGMSEQDIAVAMEPFRQLATSARWGSGGTGLGLPLTKALAEANRAQLQDQERGRTPARWSRWRSPAAGWRRNSSRRRLTAFMPQPIWNAGGIGL